MHIRKILDDIEQLPTLPVISNKVLNLLNSRESSITEIETLVNCDMTLSSKILKLINSPFYPIQDVTSVKVAINYLGFDQLKKILNITIFKDFLQLEKDFNPLEFWNHSLAVAVLSDILAKKVKNIFSEYAYISGLLHDIGKVIYLNFYPKQFLDIYRESKEKKVSLNIVEKDSFGYSHDSIGRYIINHWKLPVEVADVIGSHHRPDTEDSGLAEIINVADSLVRLKKIGISYNESAIEIPKAFLSKYEISLDELRVVIADFEREYEQYKNFIDII